MSTFHIRTFQYQIWRYHYEHLKLDSQQYRAWSDCMGVQAGLALYWYQRLNIFSSNRIKVNELLQKMNKLSKSCILFLCIFFSNNFNWTKIVHFNSKLDYIGKIELITDTLFDLFVLVFVLMFCGQTRVYKQKTVTFFNLL